MDVTLANVSRSIIKMSPFSTDVAGGQNDDDDALWLAADWRDSISRDVTAQPRDITKLVKLTKVADDDTAAIVIAVVMCCGENLRRRKDG